MSDLSVKTKVLFIILALLMFAGIVLASSPDQGNLPEKPDHGTSNEAVVPDDTNGDGDTNGDDEEEAQQAIPLGENKVPGATFGFGYTAESVGLLMGENASTNMNYLDNLDLSLEFSTEGLGFFPGGTILLQYLINNGADPTSFVGDAQATSNIEANDTQRLYQAWYNQSIADGAIEILLGMHDLNSEFYTSEYAGFFNNSSFGIGPDVAANAPVSIFNLAALGTRLKITTEDGFSLLAAIYDGDPGDPDLNHNGVQFDWDADQGFMTIVEAQFEMQSIPDADADPSIFRMGGWFHSAEFETVNLDSLATVTGNYGLYYSIDYPLSSKLGAFVHGGFAAGDRSPVPTYTGFGFQTLNGSRFLFTNAIEQTFGLAVNSAFVAEEGNNEIVIEAAWHLQITENLALKPDFQFVLNPGGVSSADPALVFSIRTEIGI